MSFRSLGTLFIFLDQEWGDVTESDPRPPLALLALRRWALTSSSVARRMLRTVTDRARASVSCAGHVVWLLPNIWVRWQASSRASCPRSGSTMTRACQASLAAVKGRGSESVVTRKDPGDSGRFEAPIGLQRPKNPQQKHTP